LAFEKPSLRPATSVYPTPFLLQRDSPNYCVTRSHADASFVIQHASRPSGPIIDSTCAPGYASAATRRRYWLRGEFDDRRTLCVGLTASPVETMVHRRGRHKSATVSRPNHFFLVTFAFRRPTLRARMLHTTTRFVPNIALGKDTPESRQVLQVGSIIACPCWADYITSTSKFNFR
jgi:hypothetical protein